MGSNNNTRYPIVLLGEDFRDYYCLKQPLLESKPLKLMEVIEFLVVILRKGWLCIECSDSTIFSWEKSNKDIGDYFQLLHTRSGNIDFQLPNSSEDVCNYSIFINSEVLSDMKGKFKAIESELLLADIYFLNEKKETVFEAANFYDGMWADSYCLSFDFSKEAIASFYGDVSTGIEFIRKTDSYPYTEFLGEYLWTN